jgi:hypothetical protein
MYSLSIQIRALSPTKLLIKADQFRILAAVQYRSAHFLPEAIFKENRGVCTSPYLVVDSEVQLSTQLQKEMVGGGKVSPIGRAYLYLSANFPAIFFVCQYEKGEFMEEGGKV